MISVALGMRDTIRVIFFSLLAFTDLCGNSHGEDSCSCYQSLFGHSIINLF